MIIYKYASLKTGIEIMKSGKRCSCGAVRLTEPSLFNDPFDSLFFVGDRQKRKIKKQMENFAVFKFACSFAFDNPKKGNLPYRPLRPWMQKSISNALSTIKETKRYVCAPFLNWVLKKLSKRDGRLKKEIEKAERFFWDTITPSVETMRKKARITCFSRRNDSVLMWSHYADSHRGVCFEYEEGRRFFKPVIYSDKKVELKLSRAVSRVLASILTGTQIDYSDKKFAETMLEPFFRKEKDWAYEEEVRCVLSDKEDGTKGYYTDGVNCYLEMTPRRILIGARAGESEDLNELLLLARDRGIPVVFMEAQEKYHKIVVSGSKKAAPVRKKNVQKSAPEMLCDEIDTAISNNLYYSSFSMALSIPAIVGAALYPALSEKEAYIRWFDENLGRYEKMGEGFPWINGNLCWELKNVLQNKGSLSSLECREIFGLEQLKLTIDKENPLGVYVSSASKGTEGHGGTLEINIRDFCWKMTQACWFEIKERRKDFPWLSLVFYRLDLVKEETRDFIRRSKEFEEKFLAR